MKNKKNIIVLLLLIIMIVVLGAGIYYSKNSKKLEKAQLEKLISTSYKIENLDSNKSQVYITISGDLSKEQIKQLNEKIYVICFDNKIKQQEVSIEYNNGVSKKDDFYYNGLLSKSKLNLKNKIMNLEYYNEIQETEISDKINDFSNETLEKAENNNVTLSFEMDTKKMEEKDILSQAKTYEDMFRRQNSKNDINNVQINIKSEKGTIYKYNSSNVNILAIDESSNL